MYYSGVVPNNMDFALRLDLEGYSVPNERINDGMGIFSSYDLPVPIVVSDFLRTMGIFFGMDFGVGGSIWMADTDSIEILAIINMYNSFYIK